jgi:hypothetical protein
MVQFAAFGLLGLATLVLCDLNPPYYANLTWQAPRTLSNWSNLTVETNTGTFIGFLNDTYPNVRQFLRVPFAQVSNPSLEPHGLILMSGDSPIQPPVGDLRWLPPQTLQNSSRRIDSTRFGPGKEISFTLVSHPLDGCNINV